MGATAARCKTLEEDFTRLEAAAAAIAAAIGVNYEYHALPYLSEIFRILGDVCDDMEDETVHKLMLLIQTRVFGIAAGTGSDEEVAAEIARFKVAKSPWRSVLVLFQGMYADLWGLLQPYKPSLSNPRRKRKKTDPAPDPNNALNLPYVNMMAVANSFAFVSVFVFLEQISEPNTGIYALQVQSLLSVEADHFSRTMAYPGMEKPALFKLWQRMKDPVADILSPGEAASHVVDIPRWEPAMSLGNHAYHYAYFANGLYYHDMELSRSNKLHALLPSQDNLFTVVQGYFTAIDGPVSNLEDTRITIDDVVVAFPREYFEDDYTSLGLGAVYSRGAKSFTSLLAKFADATTKFAETGIPGCTENAVMQRSGTCWAATLLNIVLLTPLFRDAVMDTTKHQITDDRMRRLVGALVDAEWCQRTRESADPAMCTRPLPETLCQLLNHSTTTGAMATDMVSLALQGLGFSVFQHPPDSFAAVHYSSLPDATIGILSLNLPLTVSQRTAVAEKQHYIVCALLSEIKTKNDAHVMACIRCAGPPPQNVVVDSATGTHPVDWLQELISGGIVRDKLQADVTGKTVIDLIVQNPAEFMRFTATNAKFWGRLSSAMS
jgi:hypothetical protein